MNFFQAQDQARQNTTRLIGLFILAVLSLLVMTNLLVMVVVAYFNSRGSVTTASFFAEFDWSQFGVISVGVTSVIIAGSMYKLSLLAAGGKVVAESLGGQLISRNTDDPRQRKLLDVVDEMAIASGTPVLPVYVLEDESAINAFAAGLSPGDAVISVTQGCLDQLTRDELQGVIAHEFSHVLNGDMRTNIRLVGILNGILIIGLMGYFILRSAAASMTGRGRTFGGAIVMMALGGGLMVVGFAGTFFGSLIKATISRQREFLADASAVQFTRNLTGIVGALKKIGGLEEASIIHHPRAPEFSHTYFNKGVRSFMTSLFATHPPLGQRIKRLDRNWNGKFIRPKPEVADTPEVVPNAQADKPSPAAVVAGAAGGGGLMNAIDSIGKPSAAHVHMARQQLQDIPGALVEAGHEPYYARAVIYVLIISGETPIRDAQLAHLKQHGDSGIYAETLKLLTQVKGLGRRHRLPLIEIAIGSLRQLSPPQYRSFRDNMHSLITIDSKIDLFEWSLQKIVLTHLDNAFENRPPMSRAAKFADIEQLSAECALVLSLLAHCQRCDEAQTQKAFAAGARALSLRVTAPLAKSAIRLTALNTAVDKLASLKPLVKPRLLKACVACITTNGNISAIDTELLRALSAAIDCPMPPLEV